MVKKSGRWQEIYLLSQWPKVVGETIARHTQPLRLRSGVLYVKVENGPWAHQLFLMRPKILQTLTTTWGDRTVKDIHFQIGIFFSEPYVQEPEWQPKTKNNDMIRLNFTHITDDVLRDSFAKLYQSHKENY